MTNTELLSEIKTKQPLIYMIKKDCYVLGCGAYRKCSKSEEKLFSEFNAAYNDAVEFENDSYFYDNEAKKVLPYLREIKEIWNEYFDKQDEAYCYNIEKLFHGLQQDEIIEIHKQIQRYIHALNWEDHVLVREGIK